MKAYSVKTNGKEVVVGAHSKKEAQHGALIWNQLVNIVTGKENENSKQDVKS